MTPSRREFLKMAGYLATGVGLAASGLPLVAAAAPKGSLSQPETALAAGRWGMVILTRRMADPALQRHVIDACHTYHNVPALPGSQPGPQEVKWLWADSYAAAFPDQTSDFPAASLRDRRFLLLCNHCENPPCVRVCPTGATFRREDGIVVMDYHRCIGCRYCMAGCPYGARSFNFTDPQPHVTNPNPAFPMRTRGVVEKCTFCVELLAKGRMPLCVDASEGGILFGDLADPASPVRRALETHIAVRRRPGLGARPSVYYVL